MFTLSRSSPLCSTSLRSPDRATISCWTGNCRWRKDASFSPPAQGLLKFQCAYWSQFIK